MMSPPRTRGRKRSPWRTRLFRSDRPGHPAGGGERVELLGYFKANFPKLPVVMFTGMPDDDLLDQAMLRGAAGFMRKSDSVDDLLAAVQVYVPKP